MSRRLCDASGVASADPARVRAAAARLASAAPGLQALGVRGRAAQIAGAARAFLDPATGPGEARLEAIAAAAGVSAPMLRWGLDEALSRWTQAALVAVCARELGEADCLDRPTPPSPGSAASLAVPSAVCGVALASTVPPAGLQAVAMAWLVGSAALVRPSRAHWPLHEAWMAHLSRHAPALAAATCVVGFDPDDAAMQGAFAAGCGRLVVHGADATLARWRAALGPGGRLVARGHRVSAAYLSAACVDDPAWRAEALRGLALDLCAWDQLGCLSPVALLVEQPATRTLRGVADALIEALDAVERVLPAGPWSAEVVAARTHHLRAALMRAEVARGARAALVVHEAPAGPEALVRGAAGCLHRVLPVYGVDGLEGATAALGALAPHLQALAVAAPPSAAAALGAALAGAGLNRVCAPGALQRPPLGWRHDGAGAVAPLVDRVDVEGAAPGDGGGGRRPAVSGQTGGV